MLHVNPTLLRWFGLFFSPLLFTHTAFIFSEIHNKMIQTEAWLSSDVWKIPLFKHVQTLLITSTPLAKEESAFQYWKTHTPACFSPVRSWNRMVWNVSRNVKIPLQPLCCHYRMVRMAESNSFSELKWKVVFYSCIIFWVLIDLMALFRHLRVSFFWQSLSISILLEKNAVSKWLITRQWSFVTIDYNGVGVGVQIRV